MEKIFGYFSNVKGGPASTLIGLALLIFGGIMMWNMDGLTWLSVEVGVFALGALLLIKSDEWIKSLFRKKDDDEIKGI